MEEFLRDELGQFVPLEEAHRRGSEDAFVGSLIGHFDDCGGFPHDKGYGCGAIALDGWEASSVACLIVRIDVAGNLTNRLLNEGFIQKWVSKRSNHLDHVARDERDVIAFVDGIGPIFEIGSRDRPSQEV